MERNILKRILLMAAGISIVYILISYGIKTTELLFREWVNACGIIWTGIVLPFLGLLVIRQEIYKKYDITKVKEIRIHLIALVSFVIWAFFVFLFLIFNVNEEKRLTKSLLVANEAEFLQENVFVYYEPVAFFFKKQSSLTQGKEREYLEEKYGKTVMEQYGDMDIHVYLTHMEQGLGDDLVDEVTIEFVMRALEDLKIDRKYYVKELGDAKKRELYLELKGEADIVDFSKDVSEIFTYIDDKTDFFEEYRGVLNFYSGEEESRITGYLPFGKLSSYDNLSRDYYKRLERVEVLVLEKYLMGVINLEDRKAYEEKTWQMLWYIQEQEKAEQSKSENLSGEEIAEEVIEKEGFFGEEAARRVYDEYLTGKGYGFEVEYNAKGNLYINLGYRPAGEPGDKSETGYYGHELIYNGISKNGKCEIFVLQRSYYTKESIEESTVILDMYAVETTTGQVVVGNKQSWGALGTEEYRAITGE